MVGGSEPFLGHVKEGRGDLLPWARDVVATRSDVLDGDAGVDEDVIVGPELFELCAGNGGKV